MYLYVDTCVLLRRNQYGEGALFERAITVSNNFEILL